MQDLLTVLLMRALQVPSRRHTLYILSLFAIRVQPNQAFEQQDGKQLNGLKYTQIRFINNDITFTNPFWNQSHKFLYIACNLTLFVSTLSRQTYLQQKSLGVLKPSTEHVRLLSSSWLFLRNIKIQQWCFYMGTPNCVIMS
jgi:hypothetical protein